jgi:hypothetical protein
MTDIHTIALDLLQAARAAVQQAEASGDPRRIEYAQWRLDAVYDGFCFSRDITAARISFGDNG